MTLYLLLTDRLPYDVPTDLGWGPNSLFQETPRPPSEFNAEVNSGLDAVVAKALQIDPSQRFLNAMEFLEALERWRPGVSKSAEKCLPPMRSKETLGARPPTSNQEMAMQMAQDAMKLKSQGCLQEAADLMEEAFNRSPELRTKYAPQIRLWRCGISM